MNSLSKPLITLFLIAALLSGYAFAGIAPSHISKEKFPIAVFPIENLSGGPAPLNAFRQSLLKVLRAEGLDILRDEDMERFMTKHRVRYLGGLDKPTAEAFRKETGTDAVLIISLERYDEVSPPKIALFSRLVSTDGNPAILWMDRAAMAGDDSPGLLGLGLIENPGLLSEKALAIIAKSLVLYLSTGDRALNSSPPLKPVVVSVKEGPREQTGFQFAKNPRVGEGRFGPKVLYHASVLRPDENYRIAVLPFQNLSTRKNAGEIVSLHFLMQLSRRGNVTIIDPGMVRQMMLNSRMIMPSGVSLSDVELLSDYPEIDLVLSGTVFDYQDYVGGESTPKVDFSLQLIEKKSKEVVWTSESYNQGDDGVFFFDSGRVNTANTLASEMAAATVAEMMSEQNFYYER